MEIILFLLGTSIGSFLNVVVDRIPHGQSIVGGRSHCDFCKKTLAWYDLIPILSFIFLQGKCRYCHKKLSLQYPFIEFLTGALFVFVFLYEQQNGFAPLSLIFDLSLVSCAVALCVMDFKYAILSDKILFLSFVLAAAKIMLLTPSSFLPLFETGVLSSFPLLFLFFITKGRGMGFGDVKLVAVMGFLLGFPQILVAYYVAFLTGAGWAIILILLGKKKLKGSTIAFGPFLLLATGITVLWGNTLWNYLQHLLGI